MIHRGDIYYADLRPVIGSEQGGIRPVLIVQNDVGNDIHQLCLCSDHIPDAQGKAADTCRIRQQPL